MIRLTVTSERRSWGTVWRCVVEGPCAIAAWEDEDRARAVLCARGCYRDFREMLGRTARLEAFWQKTRGSGVSR